MQNRQFHTYNYCISMSGIFHQNQKRVKGFDITGPLQGERIQCRRRFQRLKNKPQFLSLVYVIEQPLLGDTQCSLESVLQRKVGG